MPNPYPNPAMPEQYIANALYGGFAQHVRKTVTFTGAAGVGAAGTVALFTVTGRVMVNWFTAYCTTLLLTSGAATMVCGTPGDTDGFIAITTATDIDEDEWWTAATPAVGAKSPLQVLTGGLVTSQGTKLLNENINLTVASADVQSGVIVFDAFWIPITDDGALVAA